MIVLSPEPVFFPSLTTTNAELWLTAKLSRVLTIFRQDRDNQRTTPVSGHSFDWVVSPRGDGAFARTRTAGQVFRHRCISQCTSWRLLGENQSRTRDDSSPRRVEAVSPRANGVLRRGLDLLAGPLCRLTCVNDRSGLQRLFVVTLCSAILGVAVTSLRRRRGNDRPATHENPLESTGGDTQRAKGRCDNSWRSLGSIGSASSIGSFCSLGSVGSAFSIGSVGSFCSIGSVGSACSIGSIGSFASFASVLGTRSSLSFGLGGSRKAS